MKTVILAAGEGKRMRPLTLTRPKPLVEVLGKPLLAYTFESLPDEIDEVILVVGYLEDHIRDRFGDSFMGKKIIYVRQPQLTGTAGALMLARPFLSGERFIIMCADDLYHRGDVASLLPCDLGALLSRAEDPSRFGVVRLDDAGYVCEIEEKPERPKSNLVSTGVFVLDERIFNYEPILRQNGEYYLSEMVSSLIGDHPLMGKESTFWLQIGTPEDVARAEEILRSRGKT